MNPYVFLGALLLLTPAAVQAQPLQGLLDDRLPAELHLAAPPVPERPLLLTSQPAADLGFSLRRLPATDEAPPRFSTTLTGSAIGAGVGGALGAGVGLLAYAIRGKQDAEMFGALPELTVGVAAGMAVGSWVGARRANAHRGNPWVTAAGSVAGVAGGIGLGLLVGDATGSTAAGFTVAIPVAIALPALAEVATSR